MTPLRSTEFIALSLFLQANGMNSILGVGLDGDHGPPFELQIVGIMSRLDQFRKGVDSAWRRC